MTADQLTEYPNFFRVSDLCSLLESYLSEEQVKEVYRAYLFGAEAHDGQHRKSGEPYITHPLAVAKILADMRMDYHSIMAAVLHDVIEDTETVKEHIQSDFGEEVAELVDGVSKITQIRFNSDAEAQAENFRKMMLAMVRDIRVILIKLADRLHNMRTIGVMPPNKRRRIAKETLEIYVPLANRLGMNTMRLELEDLGLAALYPTRARVLREAVVRARGNRKEVIKKIETSIKRRLHQENLTGEVIGREKHLYSIYKKMKDKRLAFQEVFDVYAFRIIVDRVDTAYRVLGAMHNLYKPVPGRFKDYIAIPKANGYQSLHTVLFGPYGVPIEIQIRTEEMDKVAESGIASHWLYKTSNTNVSNTEANTRKWLHNVLEIQKSAGNSMEFIENVKIDLFPDEVYLFTPKGEILVLPRGATAVDFAYAVHTDIGNTCIACRIDRRLLPLRTPLFTGQTVEIITSEGATPNPAWLNFVHTAKARSNIRSYLKNLQQEEAVKLGRQMLDRALSRISKPLDEYKKKEIKPVLKEYNYKKLKHLLADIGLGNKLAPLVAQKFIQDEERTKLKRKERKKLKSKTVEPLLIKGTEGMVVSFAKCCHPIPGDAIIGFATTGKGIVIHTDACKNLGDYKKARDKLVEVDWEPGIDRDFLADLRLDVANRRGVLAVIAASISEMDSNIENIAMAERDGITTSMDITLTVRNRRHLARIIRRLRTNRSVTKIARRKG